MQPNTATPPTSHGSGARKVRGASGARRRMINMHSDTAVKAASVPALASAASSPKGKKSARRRAVVGTDHARACRHLEPDDDRLDHLASAAAERLADRKSTRLNSSH